MTGSTSVSVLVPVAVDSSPAGTARDSIERYLETTGFTFEIITASAATYGAAIRKGVAEASGSVVAVTETLGERWVYGCFDRMSASTTWSIWPYMRTRTS
jgi:hypothetical protein